MDKTEKNNKNYIEALKSLSNLTENEAEDKLEKTIKNYKNSFNHFFYNLFFDYDKTEKTFTFSYYIPDSLVTTFWNIIPFNIQEIKESVKEVEILEKSLSNGRFIYILKPLLILPLIFSILLFFIIPFTGLFAAIFIALIGGFTVFKKNLIKDLIKLELSKNKNWLYDPQKSNLNGKLLANQYSEMFPMGNYGRYTEDVFYGHIETTEGKNSFVAGNYTYEIKSQDSKGNSSVSKYPHHFFIFKLSKNLETRFALFPETFFRGKSKELELESITFNKMFRFNYKEDRLVIQNKVVQLLTPAVQEQLVQIGKNTKKTHILFFNDIIIFRFSGMMIPKIKSTISKKGFTLAKEDVDYLDKKISSMIQVAQNVCKYNR